MSTRVVTRSLTEEEQRRLLTEGAGLPRGEIGCFGVWLLVVAAVSSLAAGNLAALAALPERPTALAAGLATLAALAVFALQAPWGSWWRSGADRLRRRLEAGPVEVWRFAPVRGFDVVCPQARALLLELDDGRVVVVASRELEALPAGTFPEAVELEALPQLDRLLRLTVSGRPLPVSGEPLRLPVLENDPPIRKRRFVELCRDAVLLPGDWRPTHQAGEDDEGPTPGDGRLIGLADGPGLLARLLPEGLRWRCRMLSLSVPCLALPAFVLLARVPSPPGSAPSLLWLLLLAWMGTALLAEIIQGRALRRLLRGDLGAAPRAWHRRGRLVHLRGRVRAEGHLDSPLSGRRVVLARVQVPWGVLLTGDFRVETAPGEPPVRVEGAAAWLVRSPREERIFRVEAPELARLASPPGRPPSGRRWSFPVEQAVQEGDEVQVIGLLEAGVVRAADPWPVLVWSSGAALDDLDL